MTLLRFPADIAVGEVWWEHDRESRRWGHLLAIGLVQVPDGTPVTLSVYPVVEVSVSNRRSGLWAAPVGTPLPPAVPPRQVRERVTWHQGMADRAARNTRSIWGEADEVSYSIESGHEAVDLEFIRALPPDSVSELQLGDVVPPSFAAVAHLAPGLRNLSVFIDDNLGEDAPSVIAELTALERLSLAGNMVPEDGPSSQLDDHALTAIAELPALEALSLLGGSYTEHGLQQLTRLPKLQHLHLEREDLTAPMFEFAATMPALTRLTGLDEFGDGPMDPAEFARVRAMLPHISVD
ncbi:MAG TPA: hypothetical protein VMA73_05420 [Streptosporangiaceae bacterium]|nr:hypothetical protein [Streptosporangiaceae bacterium]